MRILIFFMLKKTIIFIAFIMFFHTVQAQSVIEFSLGFNYNRLHKNLSNKIDIETKGQFGKNINLSFHKYISQKNAISVVFAYTEKKSLIKRVDFYEGVYSQNNDGYIELPILYNFDLYKTQSGKLQLIGGLGVGYWIFSKAKSQQINPFRVKTDILNHTSVFDILEPYISHQNLNISHKNRLDFGIYAGVKYSFLFKNYYLFVNPTHQYTLKKYDSIYALFGFGHLL